MFWRFFVGRGQNVNIVNNRNDTNDRARCSKNISHDIGHIVRIIRFFFANERHTCDYPRLCCRVKKKKLSRPVVYSIRNIMITRKINANIKRQASPRVFISNIVVAAFCKRAANLSAAFSLYCVYNTRSCSFFLFFFSFLSWGLI